MARRPKSLRKFNGKFYVKATVTPFKEIADKIKNRYHEQGRYALIIKNGRIFQVWVRRKAVKQ